MAARRRRRETLHFTGIILTGAIFTRLVMLALDVLAARNGGAPGGEILLPVYGIVLIAIGWNLRETMTFIREALNRKETQQ